MYTPHEAHSTCCCPEASPTEGNPNGQLVLDVLDAVCCVGHLWVGESVHMLLLATVITVWLDRTEELAFCQFLI
jgi:hypothetical protein